MLIETLDVDGRIHQFRFPDWYGERTEIGWYTRPLTKQDKESRVSLARSLTPNCVGVIDED